MGNVVLPGALGWSSQLSKWHPILTSLWNCSTSTQAKMKHVFWTLWRKCARAARFFAGNRIVLVRWATECLNIPRISKGVQSHIFYCLIIKLNIYPSTVHTELWDVPGMTDSPYMRPYWIRVSLYECHTHTHSIIFYRTIYYIHCINLTACFWTIGGNGRFRTKSTMYRF